MKKLLLVLLIVLYSSISFGQKTDGSGSGKVPKIYIDGVFYDTQYLKEQIPVVDYVNDRKDADVHIQAVKETTASGGYLYTITFYGQNLYEKMNDTVKVSTDPVDSEDAVRGKVVKGIKTGLFNYLRKSDVSHLMTIGFSGGKDGKKEKIEDPWDHWVFKTSFSGYLYGEGSYDYTSLSGSVSATRTTEDLRLSLSLSNYYYQNTYSYDIDGENYKYVTIRRSQSGGFGVVKSISDHWSLGTWGSASKSTYSNLDFNWAFSGGLEYNFYPYSESSSKQIRLTYKLGVLFNKYFEETVYFKEKEYLANQSLCLSTDLIQPWGSISASLYGSNYLQDLEKYYVSFYTYFALKLLKGLSLTCSFDYSKINNQISLARGGASVEDVLLRIRQLETEYSYYVSFGFSFSFGSIFNSIVNPRFGSSSVYYD